MVKLQGPGLAGDAAGQLGGALVFSNWRGRSYAKKLTVPQQPRPAEQVASRAALKYLSQSWDHIFFATQDSWNTYPGLPHLDPYHRYCQANLKRFQTGQAPSQVWPAAEIGSIGSVISWSITAQGRRAEHKFRIIALGALWGSLIFRHTSTFSVDHFDYVTSIIRHDSPAWYSFWEGPLDPGTYYYNIRRFTGTGKLGVFRTEKTLVIS